MDRSKPKAFISHTSPSIREARRVAKSLEEVGVNAWLAEDQLTPGQDIQGAISGAIKRSQIGVVLCSADTLNSAWVRKEVEGLSASADLLVPISLDGTRRKELDHLVWIDWRAGSGLLELQGAVSAALDNLAPPLPSVAPPNDLVKACNDNDAVLYAGAGLSAPAGYPTWQPLLQGLVQYVQEQGWVSGAQQSRLRTALRQSEYGLVADDLLRALESREASDGLMDRVETIFAGVPDELPQRHRVLGQVPFSAVLTTNWDNLLEKTFEFPSRLVLTPQDSDSLTASLASRENFLCKLYGRLSDRQSLLLTPSQYEQSIAGNREFSEFMSTLFLSRTILFVGCSLEGISDYLGGIKLRPGSRRHYALVAVSGSLWQSHADQLAERYGIHVIPHRESERHPEVDDFLKELRDQVPPRRYGLSDVSRTTDQKKPGLLRSLSLTNIGPFDELSLDFNAHWNVLLGDNGLGKSTVLRAVAAVFSGKAGEVYAERLLSVDKSEGRIELSTDRETYTGILSRGRDGVQLEVLPGRPLEHEGWLVLGFPPTRQLTWRWPERISRDSEFGEPTPGDLLPLLSGAPDPRLDELKDWLFSLGQAAPDVRARGLSARRAIFDTIAGLSPGLVVEHVALDESEGRVMVKVMGQSVPMEGVSQGTAALLGWVGTLVRRLHQLPASPGGEPLSSPALVLVDELDAHMHPGWQQGLVPRLAKIFPRVQFVVTTHAPLIVSNVTEGAVFGFSRDRRTQRVVAPRIEVAPAGQGVAGLLAEFFGLETQMDDRTQELLDEKVRLIAGDEDLDESQTERLARIDEELDRVGLLGHFADPYYAAFLRGLWRRGELGPVTAGPHDASRRALHEQLTDEILEELAEDEADR